MLRNVVLAALLLTLALAAGPLERNTSVAAMTHTCPDAATLAAIRSAAGAGMLQCRALPDLTTTGNAFIDTNTLTGMGFPPPGSGTLNSNKTNPTGPAVPGLQFEGWFADDTCNTFQVEPALFSRNGDPFIPGCTPPAGSTGTCPAQCHHDGQFIVRVPDSWNGHLLSAGTPGVRDALSSDFIFSDYAMERAWAYVSQDKGNMGANFYHAGCDETGGCPAGTSLWSGACQTTATPWCPAVSIQEWNVRMQQATRAARNLLARLAYGYGLSGVTRSYITGISNGGYQTRRALETDTVGLYDGGVDWEGTLFLPDPSAVTLDRPTTGFNLFGYLPASLANYPGDVGGDATAVANLAAVGFNPESQPLWAYHWGIYWGLTQKVYRLALDPEFSSYQCPGFGLPALPCVAPPAMVVPPSDADASYSYGTRIQQLPALASRLQSIANTGDIHHPLITLHGDQDSLLPIRTDSDLYSQLVQRAGHGDIYRYYTVRGGNHVDGQFDDHSGIDAYGNTLLRPILPCARASLDALAVWVEGGGSPPPSHTIPRDPNASASDLANRCDLSAGTSSGGGGGGGGGGGATPTPAPASTGGATAGTGSAGLPFSAAAGHPAPWLGGALLAGGFLVLILVPAIRKRH